MVTGPYSIKKSVKLITLDGNVGDLIRNRTTVFITRNAYPVYAESITKHRIATALYIKVGLDSADPSDCVGYLPVAYINSESESPQDRINAGSAAQYNVVEWLHHQYGGIGIPYISPPCSGAADIRLRINNTLIQIEVKSRRTPNGTMALLPYAILDKNAPHKQLDEMVASMYPGHLQTIQHAIAYYRAVDNHVGYAGDSGVTASRSGSVRNYIKTTDDEPLTIARQHIIDHYTTLNNDYLAFYTTSTKTIQLYHIGHRENILNAPTLPYLHKYRLDTYGGAADTGGMRLVGRVAFKNQQ